MAYNDGRDLFRGIGETPVHLEGFQQDGEAQTSRPGLVAQQFALLCGYRPVLCEFVGMPVLLHAATPEHGKLFAEGAYRELSGVF